MKKMFLILLAITVLIPAMTLAEIDWTSMDVASIQTEIDRARSEISTRDIKTAEKGTILVEADGLVVTLTGAAVNPSWDGSYTLTMNYTVVNNSNNAVGFRSEKCYINGWEVSGSIYSDLDAGKKAREEVHIYNIDVDAEVTSIEDIDEIQITFLTFDMNTYMTKTDDIECTIYFK